MHIGHFIQYAEVRTLRLFPLYCSVPSSHSLPLDSLHPVFIAAISSQSEWMLGNYQPKNLSLLTMLEVAVLCQRGRLYDFLLIDYT